MKNNMFILCGYQRSRDDLHLKNLILYSVKQKIGVRTHEVSVAEKQFIDLLGASPEDRIRCVFETRKGKVTKIKVVQYETSHGFFTGMFICSKVKSISSNSYSNPALKRR